MIKDLAQFVRLPAGFSAASNIITAFVILQTSTTGFSELALLILASLSLYFSGMGLNDCFDYKEDCRERHQRPLPQGKITLSTAWILSCCLMFLGCLLAFWVNVDAGLMAILLSLLIIFYNSKVLPDRLSSLLMGLCRYTNYWLVVVIFPISALSWVLPLPLFLYVTGLTRLSKAESGSESFTALYESSFLMGLSLISVIVLIFIYSESWLFSILAVIAFTSYLVMLLWPLKEGLVGNAVQGVIGRLVIGVILMDILVLLVFLYYFPAMVLLLMLISARLLARALYVS